ncbi:DnaJ domain-containing protein [bacterium]|nr:DnaJ domain-containing protein [bacterium]
MSWDPYAALGVPRTASVDDIRKAYRKLAKELHPDVRPNDPKTDERFKRVTAAFNLLSDADQRARYDRGEIDADGNERATFQPGAGFAGFGAGRGRGPAGQRPEAFEDWFDGIFSRGPRGFTAQRGEDVRYRMEIDFLDAVNGGRKRVTVSDGRTLDLSIPAGVASGQTLRLKGQGLAGPGRGPPGDALVEVTVGAHPKFRRDGDDVRMDLAISLAEAVSGGKVLASTPAGQVSLTIPAGSNSGDLLKLRGRGVQVKPEPGDLIVRLMIVLPAKADEELTRFVQSWTKRDVAPAR